MQQGQNILVLDLETQKSFKDVGRANLHKLKVSVVCIYDYLTGSYVAYEEKETMALDKRLQESPLVIGFNVRRFDLPVLEPYLFRSIEQLPVLDLLDVIEKERGHRASLDSIAGPTLKQHKSGHGAEALVMYKEGRMDELKRYCQDDVRLTKDVYEYGCREGKILFTSSWDYKTYEIPVNWKAETEEIIQKSQTAKADAFPTSLF
ncbi:MAG TPA: ribonuclease H-like domain-containing protein [Verrucomicrobiae bacterium]|jgi:DEAD/DEAH box helicase domain-containing protein|nr:ribonuclease H-like domain-containing protein [Verrucomicrobiae bacterium]